MAVDLGICLQTMTQIASPLYFSLRDTKCFAQAMCLAGQQPKARSLHAKLERLVVIEKQNVNVDGNTDVVAGFLASFRYTSSRKQVVELHFDVNIILKYSSAFAY